MVDDGYLAQRLTPDGAMPALRPADSQQCHNVPVVGGYADHGAQFGSPLAVLQRDRRAFSLEPVDHYLTGSS